MLLESQREIIDNWNIEVEFRETNGTNDFVTPANLDFAFSHKKKKKGKHVVSSEVAVKADGSA